MLIILRKEFHDANLLKTIDELPSSYQMKFGFMSKIIDNIVGSSAIDLLRDQEDRLNIQLYNMGEAGLKEALKGHEFFLRNLALNFLLELQVPFKYMENTIFENYSLFAAAFGLVKLNLIAICSADADIEMHTHGQEFTYGGNDRLIGMTSLICRRVCQNHGNAKEIINALIMQGYTTPAHLGLLIK